MGNKHASKTKYSRRRIGKVNTPLNKKLENVEWGEKIYLKELFSIKRGKRLTVEYRVKGERPLVTAGFEKTGVAEYIGNENQETFPEDTITIDMFGNTFYRNYKYSADDNILVLFNKKEMPSKAKIFIVNLINRQLHNKFSYGKQFRIGGFEQTKIQLPIKNGKIDFDFMESFIAELEAERIKKLEDYLVANGLKDYTLTAEEKQVLKDFEKQKFGEFNVIDVFDVKNTKSILSRDIIENSGDTPYLCASTENNAISSYISYDEKYLDKGNCVFIGGKTFVVTYQEKDFYSNDSHNLALYFKNKITKLNQLYLATCINKSLGHKYSWGNSISKAKIQSDKVSLPIKDNQPDYELMDTLISAIQKLVIKDVVLYVNDKKNG